MRDDRRGIAEERLLKRYGFGEARLLKRKGIHRFREVGLLDRSDFRQKELLERWGFGGLGFYKRKGIREEGTGKGGITRETGFLKEGFLGLQKIGVIREKEIERRGIIGRKKLWRIVVFRKKGLWRGGITREELNKTLLKQKWSSYIRIRSSVLSIICYHNYLVDNSWCSSFPTFLWWLQKQNNKMKFAKEKY